MRFLFALALLACSSDAAPVDFSATFRADLATSDASCRSGDPTCDPACAGGIAPATCLASKACTSSDATFCGACGQAGKTCSYPSGTLYCGFDLYWHPVGACVDGGS